MQKNYVMLNNHDLISLVENYLEKVNVEYQCLHNRIEIYHLDRGLIVVKIIKIVFQSYIIKITMYLKKLMSFLIN